MQREWCRRGQLREKFTNSSSVDRAHCSTGELKNIISLQEKMADEGDAFWKTSTLGVLQLARRPPARMWQYCITTETSELLSA
ncbi:hypothetical protein M404DRAFT_859778 [Pisolithus tinctorius Marx 270]|uniref:Uncharacterized protein n=1 Tax=Pisolithus tinctorius Marx 270 TaxID=870435 RepID=A0A0C3NSD5_PISTI|nr:hypothetical protein M404DRAFT_859778 [Pisolithus tinctorius Marx 270]